MRIPRTLARNRIARRYYNNYIIIADFSRAQKNDYAEGIGFVLETLYVYIEAFVNACRNTLHTISNIADGISQEISKGRRLRMKPFSRRHSYENTLNRQISTRNGEEHIEAQQVMHRIC